MNSSRRVLNITNGRQFKHKQAERAVQECSAIWVEYGATVRNMTLAESITARNEQARLREPLASAEIHGLRYEPTPRSISAHREGLRLAWEANGLAQA